MASFLIFKPYLLQCVVWMEKLGLSESSQDHATVRCTVQYESADCTVYYTTLYSPDCVKNGQSAPAHSHSTEMKPQYRHHVAKWAARVQGREAKPLAC